MINNMEWLTLESDSFQIHLDKETLALQITFGNAIWTSIDIPAACTFILDGVTHHILLKDAQKKQFINYNSGTFKGMRILLSDWTGVIEKAELEIELCVKLQIGTSEIVFELQSARCKRSDISKDGIESIIWPASFDFNSKSSLDYTAVPSMQGYLIPANWDQPIIRYEDGLMFSRDSYMPWWGQKLKDTGYIAIIDTPWDAKNNLTHEAGKGTRVNVEWLASLGTFDYTRRVRFMFKAGIDYVQMAKAYRAYLKKYGKFRSLTEKIASNVKIGKLIGTAIVHTSIQYFIVPESDYYRKDEPEFNNQLVTFERRAEQLETLKLLTDIPLYVHVDGWGKRGYDNLHPDILPPNPMGGGWDGFHKLQETCNRLDILMALHDQYRDFYLDADSYDTSLVVKDRNQKHHVSTEWYGGKQGFLCPSLTKGYIERNYDQLKLGGIQPDGVYLDVFAVVPLEECHDPAHRITRLECLHHRKESLYEIESRGMIVSSEEPVDWAVPHLHLVHHAPYALSSLGQGVGVGIPVPLFSLVYHDAIVLPWSLGVGEWGIPETDWGFLHGLLNAGVPYLPLEPTEEQLVLVKKVADLHALVGCLEMMTHEFIEGNLRHQRSLFADGTSVEINLDSKEYVIHHGE